MRAALILGLTLAAPALGAETAPLEGLEWQWDDVSGRRWLVENEVQLPMFMWWRAENNRQARVAAYQIRTILDCGEAARLGRKSWEVICSIEDISIRAAPIDAAQGLLQPILEEIDNKLTGAHLQVTMSRDGRVTNLDLEGVGKRNRRISSMTETLRLVLGRTVAGLDLQLPKKGVIGGTGEIWAQYRSQIFKAPNGLGTQGASQTLHQVYRVEDDARLVVQTRGRGMVAPGSGSDSGPSNYYDTRLESVAVFDPAAGALTERVWTAVGWPTASSAMSEGTAGIPYGQRGSLRLLAPGEGIEIGPTIETTPPGQTASTIQRWQAQP